MGYFNPYIVLQSPRRLSVSTETVGLHRDCFEHFYFPSRTCLIEWSRYLKNARKQSNFSFKHLRLGFGVIGVERRLLESWRVKNI